MNKKLFAVISPVLILCVITTTVLAGSSHSGVVELVGFDEEIVKQGNVIEISDSPNWNIDSRKIDFDKKRSNLRDVYIREMKKLSGLMAFNRPAVIDMKIKKPVFMHKPLTLKSLTPLPKPKLPEYRLSKDFNKLKEELIKEGFGQRKFTDKDFELKIPQSSNKNAQELFEEKNGEMYKNKVLEIDMEMPDDQFFEDYIQEFKKEAQDKLGNFREYSNNKQREHKESFDIDEGMFDMEQIIKDNDIGVILGPGTWLEDLEKLDE